MSEKAPRMSKEDFKGGWNEWREMNYPGPQARLTDISKRALSMVAAEIGGSATQSRLLVNCRRRDQLSETAEGTCRVYLTDVSLGAGDIHPGPAANTLRCHHSALTPLREQSPVSHD